MVYFEIIIIVGPINRLDDNDIGSEGCEALCEALKNNTTLTDLKSVHFIF